MGARAAQRESTFCLTHNCLLPQVKEFQDFRRSLPQESQVIVCKNSLMKKATERVERFLPLDTALAVRVGARALRVPWPQLAALTETQSD